MEQLQCSPDLPSFSSQDEDEKNKGAASSEAGRHLKTNSSPWPSSIPPLHHHPSLPYTIHLFASLLSHPGLVSMATCFELAALGYVRVWCMCVCERVWAGKLVQGTKLRAFFVPALPLVNLSQALQGSSGRERERERGRENVIEQEYVDTC